MARRRRNRQRRGRRARNAGMGRSFMQVQNQIIKGTIKYPDQVDLSLSDFSQLVNTDSYMPVSMLVHVTSMHGPTYCWMAQWDGQGSNAYFRCENFLIGQSRTIRRMFRWPSELSLMHTGSSQQLLLTIAHAAGGDVYEGENPILFYMVSLKVVQAADVMNQTVDPPHVSIKHGAPRGFDNIEDM